MVYTVKSWVKEVDNWLSTNNQITFFYRDLPGNLQDKSYFQRASKRGHIRKCGYVHATGNYGGFIHQWMISNAGGRV